MGRVEHQVNTVTSDIRRPRRSFSVRLTLLIYHLSTSSTGRPFTTPKGHQPKWAANVSANHTHIIFIDYPETTVIPLRFHGTRRLL
jgi:hypothetical protein